MLSMISAYHQIEAVLIAVGITVLITVGVTLFAIQTKFDFTKSCIFVVICLSFALLGFGIAIAIMSRYNRILQAVYGGLGAIVMALFLAIDTQMIIGNKRFSFSQEDYIEAALQLYIDICYMFLYILQLVGAAKR
jgi:FtsH-binding integral membrane protein